jgi:outer membrane protein assembly factor BamB
MGILWLLIVAGPLLAEPTDWPEFLGPRGAAHAGPDSDIPLRWNDRLNILWRTPLPGRGWSSPVVAGDSIWLTTSQNGNKELRLLQLDRITGTLRSNHLVLEVVSPRKIHPKNTHATPTPVVADGAVYVHFGTHGTARVGLDGKVAWTATLPYYHHHGPAASPVVVGDLLIVSCDGYGGPFYDRLRRPRVSSRQFVVALDRRSGQPRWQKPRIAGRHSYSTPLVLQSGDPNQKDQVICAGGDRVVAYDPASGRELWWVRYTGYSVVPRPVAGPALSGLIYVCTGYDNPRLLAIRTDGRGDVTASHVAWQHHKAIPLNPTPLVVDDAVYLVNDAGIASCLDARRGSLRWRRRLGGHFSASPLSVNGHVLAINEAGNTHVLVPGPRYRRLAVNRLKGRTLATPAVTGNRLLIRTDRELVCVGRE